MTSLAAPAGVFGAHVDVSAFSPAQREVYLERLAIAGDLGLPTDDGSPADLAARIDAAARIGCGCPFALEDLSRAACAVVGVTLQAAGPRPRDAKGQPMPLPDCYEQALRDGASLRSAAPPATPAPAVEATPARVAASAPASPVPTRILWSKPPVE